MSLGFSWSKEQDKLLESQHPKVILDSDAETIKTLVLKARARKLVNSRSDGDSSKVYYVSLTTTDDTNVSYQRTLPKTATDQDAL